MTLKYVKTIKGAADKKTGYKTLRVNKAWTTCRNGCMVSVAIDTRESGEKHDTTVDCEWFNE